METIKTAKKQYYEALAKYDILDKVEEFFEYCDILRDFRREYFIEGEDLADDLFEQLCIVAFAAKTFKFARDAKTLDRLERDTNKAFKRRFAKELNLRNGHIGISLSPEEEQFLQFSDYVQYKEMMSECDREYDSIF